jgi:hypothetical protein
MAKGKRPWWRTALAVLGWIVGAAVVYVVITIIRGDSSGEIPVFYYFLFGLLVIGYGVKTLEDKLDAILWRLDDIERRLPPDSGI